MANKVLAAAGGVVLAGSASVANAFDTAGIQTALQDAGTNAGSLATYVVIAAAAIAGVGLIIKLIMKI